jgi:hypothetical protein
MGTGDNDGDNTLKPATTHTPLEHHAKMRAMATSTQRLLEETAGYMSGVRAQRADDIATKREREARRRRMLVEQQAAAAEAERKAESEALLSALARQSAEEQRLAARLFQLEQEKEVREEGGGRGGGGRDWAQGVVWDADRSCACIRAPCNSRPGTVCKTKAAACNTQSVPVVERCQASAMCAPHNGPRPLSCR